MRVVYFGSGDFAVPCLRWLVGSPHELAFVVTQPDRPAGRGKRLMPTPVADKAEEEGLIVERCPDVNAREFVGRLFELEADLGIVIAFGQKLLEPARRAFRWGCINLHASLLPKFRGAAPIPRAMLAGETETGVTVFRLVDRMDAGPILVQRRTAILPTETADDLEGRLARIGCDALQAALSLFGQGPPPEGQVQDESQASRAPRLTKADGYLRFDEPAERIALRCRAMWSWPGARCRFVPAAGDNSGEEVALAQVCPVPVPATTAPGTVTDVLTVATGSGCLEIHSLQPAGGRVMGWRDFVNGRHVKPGDRFEALA
ncbi:MAG: methionyl-tRNA formyltransferase [Phycisphaerae bacterium]|jgi:methionyl-tRNA formyltransferase